VCAAVPSSANRLDVSGMPCDILIEPGHAIHRLAALGERRA
jgi:hypothetical protein